MENVKEKKLGKRIGVGMLIVLGVILLAFMVLFVPFAMSSKGEIAGFYDENGGALENSVAEKTFAQINGTKQGMIIRGKNIDNPVILFLHGGPGMPEYFLNELYPTDLEEHFTVCWWEQRGAGLSYSKSLNAEEITSEQMISDIIEVTNYLRERFQKEKIYLLAHSGGSYFGIQTASRSPELFHAYIGMAQIVNTRESEKIAYNYMRDYYAQKDDLLIVRKFDKYNVNGSDEELYKYMSSMHRDNTMHMLGVGTSRDIKSVFGGIFMPVMQSKAYTMRQKINIWKGKAFLRNQTNLTKEILKTDFSKMDIPLDLPVYFISGTYDYTVNYDLTKEYCKNLTASRKGFYSFHNSAHSPLWEEPEKFVDIMLADVVRGEFDLADKEPAV